MKILLPLEAILNKFRLGSNDIVPQNDTEKLPVVS